MTAAAEPTMSTAAARVRQRRPGWVIVATKEFADGLQSVRFPAMLVILSLAAGAAVYAAAGGLTDAAQDISGTPALFLQLFLASADPIPLSFVNFVGFLGPLLGIAYGFDAINGERAQGTLPRLVSQPIHRDDVINGKFVAGASVVALVLVALMAMTAGLGIFKLGLVPTAGEVARLVAWLIVAAVYIGFWLAFAMLCSVAFQRGATSAMIAIAVWLVAALFASLLAQVAADVIHPAPTGAPVADQIANLELEQGLARLSPVTLFDEATSALLNPGVRSLGVVTLRQVDRALPTGLSFSQSLLLVWPQLVGLIALTVVAFAIAYALFMRQEVRA